MIKKYSFITLLLMSFAYAVPNYWIDGGFGQGWQDYHIDSNNKKSIWISCNISYGREADHGVRIYSNGKEIKGGITFVINDKVYYIPNSTPNGLPTSTRGGGMMWDDTMTALAKATKFDLYLNDKLIAKFTPSKANLKSILGKEDTFCKSQLSRPLDY